MSILSRLRSLRNTLFRKDRLDRELDDELHAALETLADRYVAGGLEPGAARRAAAACSPPSVCTPTMSLTCVDRVRFVA